MRTVIGYPSASGAGVAESMTAFGFPLSWYAASDASSGAYKVALLPLAVDLIVYVMTGLLLHWLFYERSFSAFHVSSRALKRLSVVLWVSAALCAAATVFVLIPDLRVEVMAIDTYFNGEGAVRQRSPAFGFLPYER